MAGDDDFCWIQQEARKMKGGFLEGTKLTGYGAEEAPKKRKKTEKKQRRAEKETADTQVTKEQEAAASQPPAMDFEIRSG